MNIENFKLVLDHIKAHPETWDQEVWHCGTHHCFAGWAQILSGVSLIEYATPQGEDTTPQVARKFLDVSQKEADYLFSARRTLWDFEAMLLDAQEAYDHTKHDPDRGATTPLADYF